MNALSRDNGGLLRFTTAGSVDDGKSSLIGRMLYDAGAVTKDRLATLERIAERDGAPLDLSLLMDGLMAEREQGITIDVAYSYFATAKRKFIIADTPGHEQYTRNMVTGASTADAAIVLVDARKGHSVQTRRHLYLSHLLGVPHLIVAVNKLDLVGFDESVFRDLAETARSFAREIGASEPHIVPISAKFGDNVVHASAKMPWFTGLPLLSLLESLPESREVQEAPFRFPVQLVRRVPTEDGEQTRHYMGRIETGRAKLGDEIAVMPSGIVTKIRQISVWDGPLGSAEAPKSVIIEVEDDVDIARGALLVSTENRPRATNKVEATICWFSDEGFSGQGNYLVKCGTRSVAGRISKLLWRLDIATLGTSDASTLKRNDIARAEISLAAPLAVDPYTENRATGSFILIDQATNGTVAAGMIAA